MNPKELSTMQKLAGLGLIIGSVLFIIAAFTPLTVRVIVADAQHRVELIQNERAGWVLLNILFGTGSILAVVGMALFAQHVQGIQVNTTVKVVGYAATALAAFGALCWVIIVYNRAVLPPQDVASNLSVNTWVFPTYTLLTQIALMLVGFVLIQSGYPSWLGWGMVILGVLSAVAYLVFKDMPPFAHYIPLLVIGIVLAR
jgi:hypothetical protein